MRDRLTRREFVGRGVGLAATGVALTAGATGASAAEPAVTFDNHDLRLSIGPDGRTLEFIDKQSGKNWVTEGEKVTCALVRREGKVFAATAARKTERGLALTFAHVDVQAVIKVAVHPNHFVFEIESVEGSADEIVFVHVPLALKGNPDEPFAACVLALNLQANVAELPGAMSQLVAVAYARFGFPGAKAAVIGCPGEELRQVLQEAVAAAPELPHSPIGGPWALGKPINQGSYLFNFDGVTEATADAWIDLCKSLGMTQIDFHGGSSFRFGDCLPNPARYPNGMAGLKAAIDRLHAAGIKAGLHTYAFFISQSCPWVSPVPDPRLGKDATFTLAAALEPAGDAVVVDETTEKMSAVTGFAVRNSVTVQIDDELIVFSGVSKNPPYGFTGCQRGAYGTKAAAHAKGAKVHHLKQCFGLFTPDPATTLFDEVAAKTAETYNACGFDMMYLDALDGSDVLAGGENAWHSGARFAYEVFKRLQRPVLMEMSTFHHHLWCVRSRYCAWDHPTRGHKRFIDVHCESNEANNRMFMPKELGWWALMGWRGAQCEPTFADDVEYLMGRCIGTDCGFALMGISPESAAANPALPRLAGIIKRYEDLRHSGKVPEPMKARLRVPGDEYALVGDVASAWHFEPVAYDKHRVADEASSVWKTENRFDAQPARLRIEALYSAGPYDAADNPAVADFADPGEFPDRTAAPGITAELTPSSTEVKIGAASGCFTAANPGPARAGTWCKVAKRFSPPLNLAKHQALGVWIHGDGQGEILNLQLTNPSHIMPATGEHYVDVDFTGWRYFELIEAEARRHADYQWPYGDIYSIYRNETDYGQIDGLALWYNNLPPAGSVTCYLGPIRAVPLVSSKLTRPVVTIAGQAITFPVEIPTGHYLEFEPGADAKLYGPDGRLIREVKPEGNSPTLAKGPNEIQFRCEPPPGVRPRAHVTVISHGPPVA